MCFAVARSLIELSASWTFYPQTHPAAPVTPRGIFGDPALSLDIVKTALLCIVRKGDDHTSRQLTLSLLLVEGPMTVRALSDAMNIGKPAVTRAIDRLVTDKYLVRADDPDDRRSVLVSLTPAGRKFVADMVHPG